MNKTEEKLRIKAIKRYLGREGPSSVYRDLDRSKSWFFKWLNRYHHGDHHWYKELSRAPKSPRRVLDPDMEQLIIQIRKKLENTKYAQIGAGTIAWELTKLDIEPPPVWTIDRVLKRNRLTKKRKKGYQSKKKNYPSIKANTSNKLHQTDLLGPRYLHTKELFRHKVKIKNILFRNASEVMSALIAAWKVLGIPEYSHSAALTRRATKYSRIHAVVVQWSRTRKRHERQGILAEPKAIQRAMQDCLTDAEIRKIRRQREQQKREEMDLKYIKEFASKIRNLFPRCPAQEEVEIAQHACRKYSGRVGRSSAAKDFELQSIILAVEAHIRHTYINYDDLFLRGWERNYARTEVRDEVKRVLNSWRGKYSNK